MTCAMNIVMATAMKKRKRMRHTFCFSITQEDTPNKYIYTRMYAVIANASMMMIQCSTVKAGFPVTKLL